MICQSFNPLNSRLIFSVIILKAYYTASSMNYSVPPMKLNVKCVNIWKWESDFLIKAVLLLLYWDELKYILKNPN